MKPRIRPGQPVTIDFFRPEDADGVVLLFKTGAGLVLPPYRHTTGIISKLVRHGMEEAAPRFGLGEIFGETEKGVEIFQVWIRLSRPWCGVMVETLREQGYFLGGILPRRFDEDGLLMQKNPGNAQLERNLHTNSAKKAGGTCTKPIGPW